MRFFYCPFLSLFPHFLLSPFSLLCFFYPPPVLPHPAYLTCLPTLSPSSLPPLISPASPPLHSCPFSPLSPTAPLLSTPQPFPIFLSSSLISLSLTAPTFSCLPHQPFSLLSPCPFLAKFPPLFPVPLAKIPILLFIIY